MYSQQTARWQCNFKSGILASGKTMTRMAPKPSKTTTAWWPVIHIDPQEMLKFDHELMVIPSFNTSVIFLGGKVFLESRFCFPSHNDEMSGPVARKMSSLAPMSRVRCPLHWQSIFQSVSNCSLSLVVRAFDPIPFWQMAAIAIYSSHFGVLTSQSIISERFLWDKK